MRRTNGAVCGFIIGLAVIAGCAKKKPPTEASVQAPAPPGAVTPPARPTDPNAPPGATVGAIELVQGRFDKVESALTAAKGKVVLVDCWARWCPPCVASFPELVKKHEKYKDKGLVCMSVNMDSGRKVYTTQQVHAFLTEHKATFQNFYLTDLAADDAKMDARFGEIQGIPHAALFNRKGEQVWNGHPMDRALLAKIETELAAK